MITGKWCKPGDAGPCFRDALAVRMAVFVREQGFPAETEQDALDDISWHAVLYLDDAPVATGRIYWAEGEFHLGRICVDKSARGTGCGDLLMRLLLFKALDHHAHSVTLSAQLPVVPFYARYGFVAVEEAYLEDNVPHQRMRALAGELRLESKCRQRCADCPGCPAP